MTYLVQYRLVEDRPGAVLAPTTGECEHCARPLKVDPDTLAWVDDTGHVLCPATETLCERLCRPHPDAPQPCGLCLGTGSAYALHDPDPDTLEHPWTPPSAPPTTTS